MVSRVVAASTGLLLMAGSSFCACAPSLAASSSFAYRGAGAAIRNTFSPYAYPGYRTDDVDRFPSDSGTYRTLCVRLCDGFYFPISFATSHAGLRRDADQCTARCGDAARLFYHPNPGGDVDGMKDLAGRAYSTLPTAFKYRKTLVEGCGCRPQPRAQANGEGETGADVPQAAPTGDASGSLLSGGVPPLERPEPIARQFYRLPYGGAIGAGRNPPVSHYLWPDEER
jgi:hypothetical protein